MYAIYVTSYEYNQGPTTVELIEANTKLLPKTNSG